MKIAIAQLNTRAGDFEETASRMVAFCASAHEQGAELVVFPMAVLTGQLPLSYALRAGYMADLYATLNELAHRLVCPCLVPVVTEYDGEPYHEVMLLQSGQITPLRARSWQEEQKRAQEGRKDDAAPTASLLTVFEHCGLQIALAQTYDDLDDLISTSMQADVVVYVSDYAFALDDVASALGASLGDSRYKADAVALDAWFVAAGSLGGYGLQVYAGSSFVLAPTGELVASAPAFEENLLVAEVGTSQEGHDEDVSRNALEPEIYNSTLHLWEALTLGLRDYMHKQGKTDVALVLDGGLASCLLAVLASDALGPMHVHAVLGAPQAVPQAEEGQRIAGEIAKALRLLVDEDTGDHALPATGGELFFDCVQVALASTARKHNAVALGCEDKTFLSLEVVSNVCRTAELLPFGDVYRSDLIELAHLRNTISPIIPTETFACYSVPVVDGLEEAEPTPEQRLRFVDVTLIAHVEWERSLSDVALRQNNKVLVQNVLGTFWKHEAARGSWPPCLAVSSHPLFLLRNPLGHAWQDHVRTEDELHTGEEAVRGVMSPRGDARGGRREKDMESSFAEFLEGLELDVPAGRIPEGVSPEVLEGTLGELIGLLQDLLQNGEQPPSIEGPFGPLTWGSPFSEN